MSGPAAATAPTAAPGSNTSEPGRFSRLKLSNDTRLTGWLFLLSFFIVGVPRVYTQTAAHTLFIAEHGAAAMPWAYLAEALCVPLAGGLYIAATQRLSLRTLIFATLASQVIALALLRGGIALQLPLVAGAAIVYFEIEFVLSSLLLWGLAGQLMCLRQGRRLFGFISAGEPVAVIAGGIATPWLLRWLAPADLFWLSAAGAAVGIALALHILRHHRPLAEEHPAEGTESVPASDTVPAASRSRYAMCLVLLVAVGQLAYFFVDNAFYVEAGTRYASEQALASFLGTCSAVIGAVSLASSALLAPWLSRRFGVHGGLLLLPLLLLAGSAATVLGAAFGGPAELLFVLVVGNKVIDQSLRYTVDKTTFVTLLQPVPTRQRLRLQAGLESIVEPLAGGVAGLLLFGLLHGLGWGAAGITGVILVVAAVWIALVSVQYRGYLGALRQALTCDSRSGDEPALPPVNPQWRERVIEQVDAAVSAILEWDRWQRDASAGVDGRAHACIEVVEQCIANCFAWLPAAVVGLDPQAAHRHYCSGDPVRRAYVLELLDNTLDAALKRRLLPLLEPASMAERALRQRAFKAVSEPG